jgi:hypothetical protein
MGLFDGQPLTMEEIQLRHERAIADGHGIGSTIRKLSGGAKPVLRTMRHRPWWEIAGRGPDGKTCGDCASLVTIRRAGTYFKCGEFQITRGPGTDIRKKDQACTFFKAKGGVM